MIQTMTQETPPWLAQLVQIPAQSDPQFPTPAEIARIKQQDQLDTFEALFEPAINALSGGTSITKFLSMDHRQPHPGQFMRWLKADPDRYRQYLYARDIAAELISNDIIGIADGTDNPLEDVARSKLRVDARKVMMSFDNKERFTTTTKIDVSSHQTIDVTAAMAPALSRAKEMQRLARERMAMDGTISDVVPRRVLEDMADPDPTDPDGAGEDD